jgi:aryl-alcohol dehydrogenase-like predicted oxidoreductase
MGATARLGRSGLTVSTLCFGTGYLSGPVADVGRDEIVDTTKTYASTAAGARRSLTKALRELRVETVDIFLLHAVDSAGELEAKRPALETPARAKAEGLVRAVGVSSHSRERLRQGRCVS